MSTDGYEEGDEVDIPFRLAPSVINRMRRTNPQLTLIGCKMLVGAKDHELLGAAEKVLVRARCNVVIANDQGRDLKRKLLVYPDRSVFEYDNDFEGFYRALDLLIRDQFYQTSVTQPALPSGLGEAKALFDRVVAQCADRFYVSGSGHALGSLAVRSPLGWLCSSRGKLGPPKADEASLVTFVDQGARVTRVQGPKATLNAPLLTAVGDQYEADVVLHLHEHLEGLPMVPYAPPGTQRDNDRDILGTAFNIRGHGFVMALSPDTGIPRGKPFGIMKGDEHVR